MRQQLSAPIVFAWFLLCLPILVSCSKKNSEQNEHAPKKAANVPALNIYMDSLDQAFMVQLRNEAVKLGVLSKETKQKFPCVIEYLDKRYSAKIRFKGDWTDHLQGEKWSYRVELNDGHINGKATFSIQRPDSRGYGQEWLVHQLCAANDVLATHYSFLPVSLNGKNMGIYAFEEHFEKELLESQERREGVILKFDEDLFWAWMIHGKINEEKGHFPYFEASVMLPFKKKRTLKSESLKRQLELGNNLVELYQRCDDKLSDYMDVDRFAKYYAILTLANASHARNNQRWYVNPVTALLEPIGYDCYSTHDTKVDSNTVFHYTTKKEWYWPKTGPYDYFLSFLFQVPQFQERYLHHLNTITNEDYLRSFFNQLKSNIQEVNDILAIEHGNWPIDTALIYDNAKRVLFELPKFRSWLDNEVGQMHPDTTNKRSTIDHSSPNIPVLSYQEDDYTYTLQNYGGQTAAIVGYKPAGGKEMIEMSQKVTIGVSNWRLNQVRVKVENPAKEFYYRLEGDERLLTTASFAYPSPKRTSPRRILQHMPNEFDQILVEENGYLRLKEGAYKLNQILFIPSGTILKIDAGTRLELGKSGGVISESPVILKGTKENPITISSNEINHGFSVMRTDSTSQLSYVTFSGMSNLDWNGWTLTGGINFYEADVVISDCEINNGKSEDALNIIRSEFELLSSSLTTTVSDGFDSDFSYGTIRNSVFQLTGNDGLDFSGSFVTILDSELKDIGDKAVSCGEESTITINNLTVREAEIGIAAKDKSVAVASDVSIEKAAYGIVAYTKKSEYGGANIELKDISFEGVEHEHDIELGSKLLMDDEEITGKAYSRITKY